MKKYLLLLCLTVKLVAEGSFAYEVPKNFGLQFGKGVVHHPVSTENQMAQNYFDQGLSYLYAFNHDAAFWSFKRAAENDPNLAMAYWGMAYAIGPNINGSISAEQQKRAYELSQEALKLSENASPKDKAYIDALSKRYAFTDSPDWNQLNLSYKDAMHKVVQQYPDDLDAATLYSESLLDIYPWNQWDENKNPRDGTLEAVSTLESVLLRDPDHLGANHFYIHSVEASKHPEWALPSANRLRTLAPNAGHLLHMPAHIYSLIGDQHAATLTNLAAVKADRDYMDQFGVYGNYPIHYYSHVLHFLTTTQGILGNYDDAIKTAQELAQFVMPHFSHMPHDFAISAPYLVDLRFHNWQGILKRPLPSPEYPQTTAIAHFSRAMAFSALGYKEKAKEEEKLFEESRRQLPENAEWGYNPASKIMELADYNLKAQMAEQDKNPALAIQYLDKAEKVYGTLGYNEPEDWFLPVYTPKGGIFLRNGQYVEAEKAFRQQLANRPNDPRALFGLTISLKQQNKLWDAYWTDRAFRKAWQYSTVPLNVQDL